MRRLMLGMTQQRLAERLHITFQQIQKYENGTNRISASRLQQLSNILDVPVSFFFEQAPKPAGANRKFTRAPSLTYVNDFLSSSDGLALLKAFMQIDHAALRRSLVRLVEGVARNTNL
jgi:transcriptional regulator with XRE-family HTH domain